ncbi:MAG: tetratricopeptide repeat protein, partial [Thermoplasmata archaeon]
MARTEEIAKTVKSLALYHKKDIKNAEKILDTADNSNPDTWIYRGNLKFQSGDFASAIECYNEALKLAPNNVAAMYNKANALLQIGDYLNAEKILEKLVEDNPHNEEIWNNLGNIYARKGKLEDAISAYTRAIELNPEYTIARYNLGMVLARNEQYAEAIEQFSWILERKEMMEAYCAKASCEYAIKDFTHALESLNKAISLDSKNLDAWILRAAILAEMEQAEDAFNTFREAIKIDPECAETYFAAAKFAAKLNRLKDCEEYLKDGIEKNPDNVEAWELLADVEYLLGRYEGAIFAGEKVLSLSENYERKWYIYYLLGCSHFEKKEFREALEYLERTVSEN